jgi:nitrogen regulatory protein PII
MKESGMKRITTVLKESEAVAVRKAVCMAGAERIVITPLPYRICGVDQFDIYSEQMAVESCKRVRLDVTANDIHHGGIIFAIRRVVRTGRVILTSCHDILPKRTA